MLPTEQTEELPPAVCWTVFVLIYGSADLVTLFEDDDTASILHPCFCLFTGAAHSLTMSSPLMCSPSLTPYFKMGIF